VGSAFNGNLIPMNPELYGYNTAISGFLAECGIPGAEPGRIIAEHRERYVVMASRGETEAEITGNMRFTARSRLDYPAVGDWVALISYGPELAIIHSIFPRSSVITRQSVGRQGEVQVIAANIDVALLVQSADRDFNLNRLERYLTICYTSRVEPVIVLSKTDLAGAARVAEIRGNIESRIKDIPLIALSNETREGYELLEKIIQKGKTYCMLGSSGVGKSSLLNNLSGSSLMKTGTISSSTSKGRHITSHRELTLLDNGGILIDNPGMREVGITDEGGGLEVTFGPIMEFARECRFSDCTHSEEAGCAVIAALKRGEIDPSALENFRKMEKERSFYESSLADRRKKEKEFGKIMKNYKKDRKNNDL
jgi:ribosome biogenesis GTPase / thiamine phosphate phosphatase